MQLNPYLFFDGQCAEAFNFYADVLRGKVEAMMTSEGMPGSENIPPEQRGRIMHARLSFGDKVLMGSDCPANQWQPMQGFSLTVSVDEPAEAERIFAALSPGATVRMPIEETFWARRFGMLVDRYGTPWMINCERPGH
ncbi:MAG: VOC family protein [Thiohalocapsa sp.]